MNKLAVLAMSLLLFFGAMLWYLANNTLNEFVSSQVILQGEYYSQQKVTIGNVSFNAETGSGTISNIGLSTSTEVSSKQLMLANNIVITLGNANTASLLTEIDSVAIDELTLWLTDTDGSNIKTVVTTIEQQLIDIVPKKTPPKILPNGVVKKKREKIQSKVTIANIMIKQLTIHVADPLNPQKTHTVSKVNISLPAIGNHGEEQALPVNQLGANLLLHVFNHVLSISSL